MKKDVSGVVVYDNENGKMLGPHALLCVHALGLMHYCVFMHWGILFLFHNSTDAHTTKQGNDHYVYHNAAMTFAIPNGCPTSTATREYSSD